MTSRLPSGTVTFVFTDIEGSTRMARQYRDGWEQLRGRHHSLLRLAFEAHKGYVFEIVGDAFCVAFDRPIAALLAALEAQRSLQAEPWDPEPVRVRMGIHTGAAESWGKGYRGYLTLSSAQRVMSTAHGGQVILSQSAYDLIESDVPEELELRDMGEHRLKDLLRRQHLYQLVVADLPSEFPPLRSLDVQPHNLPIQLTTFIGREQELAEIAALLDRNRLVTLTGLAGTGKTRLALQVAAEVLGIFPDGAWFVELAHLTDPALVPQTILSGLRLHEQTGRESMAVLRDALASQKLLLILDNCEHLLEACAQAADEVLHAAPDVRVLATSREGLNISGGANYPVHALPLPDASTTVAQEILHVDSVRLFTDRAEAVQPTFRITDANAACVAQICTRLDGIPLALELAAARVGGMTLEQIDSRLDHRFRLLTGGSRTALPRQRTLQATIDWSHNLLSDAEKVFFRRLAVFSGGWPLEAAQQVAITGELDGADALELLADLVEKSLVVLDQTAGRYSMLETVHEYALDRLREAGEETSMRGRHLDHWVRRITESDPDAASDESSIAPLARDIENLFAAAAWCEAVEGGIQKGLALMGATRFWMVVAQFDRAFQATRRLLERPDALPRNHARQCALHTFAHMGGWSGQTQGIMEAAEESLAIARDLSDVRGEAEALHTIGMGRAYFGDDPAAIEYFRRALPLAEEAGLPVLIGMILNNWGESLRTLGDLKAAERKYEESLPYKVKYTYALAIGYLNLCLVALGLGQIERARERLLQAFATIAESHFPSRPTRAAVEFTASYLVAVKDFANAARLQAASVEHLLRAGEATNRADQIATDPMLARAREVLGAEAFGKLQAEGRRLSLQDAFAEARRLVEATPAAS
jgi:predicted ATPase/class 3 adenylate cyclase/Tfp pilus assembly protein PilF